MTQPKRIQAKRTRGWRLPPNTMVVTRSSRYGNPHKITRCTKGSITWFEVVTTSGRHAVRTTEWEARELAVELFDVDVKAGLISVADLERLRGQDVACSCDPADGMACHGDVLLLAANPGLVLTRERPGDDERDWALIEGRRYEVILWGSDCDACGGNTSPDSSTCNDCGQRATPLYRLVSA